MFIPERFYRSLGSVTQATAAVWLADGLVALEL